MNITVKPATLTIKVPRVQRRRRHTITPRRARRRARHKAKAAFAAAYGAAVEACLEGVEAPAVVTITATAEGADRWLDAATHQPRTAGP